MEHANANSSFVPLGEIGSSMQIVWCGHRLLDFIHGVQLGNYGIFKTSALVTVNMGKNAIHIEPFLTNILAMVNAF